MSFSDANIIALIECPKTTTKAPRREMRLERGSLRNDAELISEDGEHHFRLFVRQSAEFLESFSIGLIYEPRDGSSSITLLRCNGPHGQHRNIPFAPDEHFHYHIHEATAAAIAEGERAERYAEKTDKYAAFEQALAYFLRRINLLDRDVHFPWLKQLPLWPQDH